MLLICFVHYNTIAYYINTNGCENIDGGGWVLVRRVKASDNKWHPIDDDLNGVTNYGTYSNDAQADSTWSIGFSDAVSDYDQFLFSTGNCQYWLVTEVDQATEKGCRACDRKILNSSDISSHDNSPYYAEWYNRDEYGEDPWISIKDHIDGSADTGDAQVVYGENSKSGHLQPMINNNGANVWIRNTHGMAKTSVLFSFSFFLPDDRPMHTNTIVPDPFCLRVWTEFAVLF